MASLIKTYEELINKIKKEALEELLNSSDIIKSNILINLEEISRTLREQKEVEDDV
jgi:hypothetical protein